MPITKNAMIRYKILDRCFRNTGRNYGWKELLEECNRVLAEYSTTIGRTQLFKDIKFMESEQGWQIDLERTTVENGRTIYRYHDPKFSITNELLGPQETQQLMTALEFLSRFSGTPQFQWVDEMIPMLEEKFQLRKKSKKIMHFESNENLKGKEHLPPLYQSILEKIVLKVLYQDFLSSEPYEIVIHPHYLKQYNSRWFLFGYNEEQNHPYWNLALDRIVEIHQHQTPFKDCEVDWEEWFDDIIGVSRNPEDKPEEVRLQFSQNRAPYVETKPLHPSQINRRNDQGLLVTLKIIPNRELVSLICSFSEDVEVLSPVDLRREVAAKLHHARIQYLT